MAVAPLMQRFVEDELSRSVTLIERCLTGTLALLRDHHRDGGLTAGEREHHYTLVEALQRNTSRFQTAFLDALRAGVMRELQAQHEGPAGDLEALAGGLELMDETRVEVDIEISRATQLIDTTAEWELRELQTFTSTLGGQQHVSAESNPLRPLVYATALWQAAGAVVPVQAQQAILLRIAAGVIAGLLKNAWAAASTRLESQGVEPGIYRTVLLAPGSTTRAPQFDATQPGALNELLSRMPGALAPAATLLGRTAGASGTGSAPQDPRVVELLSRVFALIQADTQINAACRAVLARLQVAALRVALQDRSVFESPEHPVWLLMDRIAHASAGHPLPDDTRHAALLAFCDAVAEEISRSPMADATMFRRGALRVDSFLAEQLQWQQREAVAAIEALRRREKGEILELHLAQRLTEQMAPVRTTPEIRRFVTGTWARVLAESILQSGEEAEPTPTYMKTVDDLVWSLRTPDHPQSRQRLLALLPSLLQRLRAGMTLVGLAPAEQQALLDPLMAAHTEALRPGARAAAPAALTPEQIVQRMREEVIDETPSVRPFSDSVIDFASMDTVPADFMNTHIGGSAEDSARRVEALAAGQRRRLFVQGRWNRVQLLWRSDQGQYYLFAGERPGRTHSIARRALERLDAAGLMLPLETQSLVQRTLDALLNQISLDA
jgi:muconolactone delta-isomerase